MYMCITRDVLFLALLITSELALFYGRKVKYHKQVVIEFSEFAEYTCKTKSMALFFTLIWALI